MANRSHQLNSSALSFLPALSAHLHGWVYRWSTSIFSISVSSDCSTWLKKRSQISIQQLQACLAELNTNIEAQKEEIKLQKEWLKKKEHNKNLVQVRLTAVFDPVACLPFEDFSPSAGRCFPQTWSSTRSHAPSKTSAMPGATLRWPYQLYGPRSKLFSCALRASKKAWQVGLNTPITVPVHITGWTTIRQGRTPHYLATWAGTWAPQITWSGCPCCQWLEWPGIHWCLGGHHTVEGHSSESGANALAWNAGGSCTGWWLGILLLSHLAIALSGS